MEIACSFHSVAAALERLLLQSTAASRHVLRRVPLTCFSSGTQAVLQQLRSTCAGQIDQWTWEELYSYLVTAAMNQELGTWSDQWNPTAQPIYHQLECIIGYVVVRAVGDNPHGDAGDSPNITAPNTSVTRSFF